MIDIFKSRRIAIGLSLAMLGAAALAEWARPTIKVSDSHPDFKLEQIFPRKFADWQVDESIPVVVPPPDQQALLDKIYNQTLARTYINRQGKRVMLSVAYGGDQSDGLSVHIPDVCYVGQGFKMVEAYDEHLDLPEGKIPVRNLMMTMGARQEPVTYWVMMGDQATISNTERRVVSIRYGLRRMIPEGMLVRISTFDGDLKAGVATNTKFVQQLVAHISVEDRLRVVGRLNRASE